MTGKKLVAIIFLTFLCFPVVHAASTYGEVGSYYRVYNVYLNTTVMDADNDHMNVGFYWGNYTRGNYTLLEEFQDVPSGTQLSVFLPDFFHRDILVNGNVYTVPWLEHGKRYEWFLYGYDGKNVTITQAWFNTCYSWDLNMDGKVNILDIVGWASHYREHMSLPGASPWDINEDTYTDYLDLSLLIGHYGESY